jgi:hypothetical protein
MKKYPELTLEPHLVGLRKLEANTKTDSGLDLSMVEGSVKELQNNLPFEVVIPPTPVEGIESKYGQGDLIYLQPGCTLMKMVIEEVEIYFARTFDVLGKTTSFNNELHNKVTTTIDNEKKIELL